MRSIVKPIYLFLLAVLLLSACNMPVVGNTPQPTGGALAVQTAAAQTVQALQTQIAGTPSPTRPATLSAPTAVTQSPPNTSAPPTASIITNIPPSPATRAPTAAAALCDRVGFVDDVTVDDGTAFAPGQSFTKTWRLKNNGTCTWSTAYRLVFDKGDAMGGPAAVNLPKEVAPGGEIDLSVNLVAPTAAKEYRGDWKLQNASGQNFGIGAQASESFWVKIVVGSPTAGYFAVTGGVVSADPTSYSGACPITLKLTAKLTVSAPGTVTYFWERSDGGKTKQRSLEFSSAGTNTVTEEIEGVGFDGYVFDGDYRLYVDQPNHQYFGPVDVQITCD